MGQVYIYKEKMMNIGIDIDNTITYTTEMILHYARIFGQEHGLNTVADPNEYYLEEALGWSSETVEEFFDTYLVSIYQEVRPKEQAREITQQLHKQHQIMLITSRNYQFPGIEEVTRKWLQEHGIAYDRLILNATPNMYHFSKLAVCLQHGVNVMLEDHHDLARELSEFMPVILFDYPYNRHVQSENILRVNNWHEAYSCLNCLTRAEGTSRPIA
jgi:uncharacterized HAD superfamily protein